MIGRPFSTKLLITIAALLLLPLLPNRLAGQQERQQSGEYATIGGRRVLLHIVQPKETLFSICRAYNVTQQELLKLNPQLAAGLKAGSSIIIRDLSIATQEENDAYLFSSSLSGSSLSYQREDSTANSAQNAAADTTALSESAELYFPTQEPAEAFAPLIGKRIERIGLILPLNTATGSFSNNYMDFYAGALLAADEQKREGGQNAEDALTINVYDQSQIGQLDNMRNLERFADNSIIIGPVKRDELAAVAPYLNSRGIPVISPMDAEAAALLEEAPLLIQVPPAHMAYQQELSKAIIASCQEQGTGKVVVLRESGVLPDSVEIAVEEHLRSNGIEPVIIRYGILEGRVILATLKSHLEPEGNNIIFCHSNNEAFITDAVRNIGLCISEGLKVITFGNAKWKNIGVINAEQLHAINLHLIINYHVDYSREEVKAFLYKYRALFAAEPSAFSFQGYDIVKYLLEKLIPGELPAEEKMLQIEFRLKRLQPGAGYINWGMHHIIYNPDYTITEL